VRVLYSMAANGGAPTARRLRHGVLGQSETGAKLAQELGQLQPFLAVFPPECMGPTCTFWANLTRSSLKYLNTYGTPAAGRGLAVPAGWTEWGGLVRIATGGEVEF
jgi:hypothetical protein